MGTEQSAQELDWVPLSTAGELTGCNADWLLDRCRDGRLPSRPAHGAGEDLMVPLATVRALVKHEITE